jgi:hypothetical protein
MRGCIIGLVGGKSSQVIQSTTKFVSSSLDCVYFQAERVPTLLLPGESERTCELASLLGVLRYLGTIREADSGLLQPNTTYIH